MFNTIAFTAALIAGVNAAIVEDKLTALNGWNMDALLHSATAPTFEQKDAMQFFMMDPTLMFSDPAVPSKGITLNFHMGGMFMGPNHIDHLNFKCKLDGIPVYNENFDVKEDVSDQWTHVIPFDVPKIAPSSKYDVTFSALSTSGKDAVTLFEIESIFHL
jgi:hypothetical protein